MEEKIYKMLDDLSKEFYDTFKNNYSTMKYEYRYENTLIITIPAKVKKFGDIKIFLERPEIVIELGNHFHTHFERYSSRGDIEKNEVRKEIISETIEFIDDVLNDKILLKVVFKGDKLISSSIKYIDDEGSTFMMPLSGLVRKIIPKKSKVEIYSWSGKYVKFHT